MTDRRPDRCHAATLDVCHHLALAAHLEIG
jgi:hypothetical protein